MVIWNDQTVTLNRYIIITQPGILPELYAFSIKLDKMQIRYLATIFRIDRRQRQRAVAAD